MPNLKIEPTKTGIAVYRTDGADPILQQHAEPNTRAYIHPIVAPDGNGILTEDTPPHHPWQHGLYVGLNDVNGLGFWMEGLSEKHKTTDGTFHPHPITNRSTHQNSASWTVTSDWKTPTEHPVLTETQAWTLTDQGPTYTIDITWALTATTDLTFGQYAYGGLFLRMPYKKEIGGQAINSEGQVNNQAEGQRARWVSVSMPISGRTDWAGIAMFDHPTNPEHPNPWRVDSQLGIVPSRCIAKPWTLNKNESTTNRYRLLVFTGQTDTTLIDTHYQQFAK